MLERRDIERDPRQLAVNTLPKGPEIQMPGGLMHDRNRKEMRVKWWLNDDPLHYGKAALQVPFELPDEPLTEHERKIVCGYPADAPPVFFGHYGFLKPAEAFAPNVACLDLAITSGGPLCAYRMDNEQQIDPAKFVVFAVQPTAVIA